MVRFLLVTFWLFLSQSPVVLQPPDAFSTIYECVDHSGQTIFTDSPVQLLKCREYRFNSDIRKKEDNPISRSGRGTHSNAQPHVSTSSHFEPQVALPTLSHLQEPPSSSTPTFLIPVQNLDGAAVVQAHLNKNTELTLLLNLEENMTVLRQDIGQELGLILQSNGGMKETDSRPIIRKISMVQIGPAKAYNLPVKFEEWSNANTEISGRLGASFFKKHYRLVDFDLSQGYLQLQMRVPQ